MRTHRQRRPSTCVKVLHTKEAHGLAKQSANQTSRLYTQSLQRALHFTLPRHADRDDRSESERDRKPAKQREIRIVLTVQKRLARTAEGKPGTPTALGPSGRHKRLTSVSGFVRYLPERLAAEDTNQPVDQPWFARRITTLSHADSLTQLAMGTFDVAQPARRDRTLIPRGSRSGRANCRSHWNALAPAQRF